MLEAYVTSRQIRIGSFLPFHTLHYATLQIYGAYSLSSHWPGSGRMTSSIDPPGAFVLQLVPRTHLSSGVPALDARPRQKHVPINAVDGRPAKSHRDLSAEHSRVLRLAN
ncbi:hypothetical protein RSAG8_12783, partial [Rhizoctonia solani AG-8 WAC10335]